MCKTGILKDIFNKGWNTAKLAYHKAHAAHESLHNIQDKVDGFQAKRQVQHAVRPLNREENKIAAMQKQYIDSATAQAHKLATLYGYTAEEEAGLRDRLLAKYKAADSRQEAVQVHSNINTRIENIKRGLAKDKEKLAGKVDQGIVAAKMGAVRSARSLSTGMGMKPPSVKIKPTISHNGKRYTLIKRFGDIRSASQKMQKLREAGRLPVVHNVTDPKGREWLAVYAAPVEGTTKAHVKKSKLGNKIQKALEIKGRLFKFAGKYLDPDEAMDKMNSLGERGYLTDYKNVKHGTETYIAIYAAKPTA